MPAGSRHDAMSGHDARATWSGAGSDRPSSRRVHQLLGPDEAREIPRWGSQQQVRDRSKHPRRRRETPRFWARSRAPGLRSQVPPEIVLGLRGPKYHPQLPLQRRTCLKRKKHGKARHFNIASGQKIHVLRRQGKPHQGHPPALPNSTGSRGAHDTGKKEKVPGDRNRNRAPSEQVRGVLARYRNELGRVAPMNDAPRMAPATGGQREAACR